MAGNISVVCAGVLMFGQTFLLFVQVSIFG